MAEEGRIVVKVNREVADIQLEVTKVKQEKLRKKFENESLWPLVNRGPFGALIYGMFLYPRVFFNHIIMENPKYSVSIFQETLLRSIVWSMKSPLKTLRRSGAFMELLIKVFHCSEPFHSLESKVKALIGVSEGYWLGPVKHKQRESEATILYLHGGGYVALSSLIGLKSLCYLLKKLRKRYNKHVRVLAIDYTLAPEEPFPAGLNCVERAYKWLVTSGIAGSKNVFLCGDSAGAGLTFALLQKLLPDDPDDLAKMTHIPLPLGVIAISPWVELSCDSLSYFTNAESDWISGQLCQFAAEYYIYGKEGNPARKREKILQQQPKINRDIILEWLEKVEDNLDLVDIEGKSRLQRMSLELSKRLSGLSINSKRLSVNSKRLSVNSVNSKRHSDIKAKKRGSRGAITQKRNSRIHDSFIDIKHESTEMKSKNETSKSKTREENPYRDPLISPLHTPHHILAKFPPLLITYGGKEIFKDDIEMFIQKCIESKRIYTSFDNYDNTGDSLDGQHPDILVEMDEEMVHDYPMFIDIFGKHSKKALDRIVDFIANRVPHAPTPIRSFQSIRRSTHYSRPKSKLRIKKSQSLSPIESTRPKSDLRTKKSQTISFTKSTRPKSDFNESIRPIRPKSDFNESIRPTRSKINPRTKFQTYSLNESAMKFYTLPTISSSGAELNTDSLANPRLSTNSINSRRIPSFIPSFIHTTSK